MGSNHRKRRTAAAVAAAAVSLGLTAAPAAAAAAPSPSATTGSLACSPSVAAVGFSDTLDKARVNGVQVGGLSSLAYDSRSHSWLSAVDDHGPDPARIWSFRDLRHPVATKDPLVLRMPDGTPYDGTNSDFEGLAVLPDGDYLVSSEVEPTVRIFGRDGMAKAELPVPARFAVAPGGEATFNSTFEGLTLLNSGREIVVSMEDALSGDVSSSGDAGLHRFLIYAAGRGGQWQLAKQVAYRTEPGMRVPEIAGYGKDSLVVEEAGYAAATGSSVNLFAVTGLDRARDVSAVDDLSTAPAHDVLAKQHLADLVNCPTLGATAKEHQTNPLMENFEGMAVVGGRGPAGIDLISDDNFGPLQTTRVLRLAAWLP